MKTKTAAAPAPYKAPDLASFDSVAAANTGSAVDLYSPKDGADLNIRIHVLGRDSDAFKSKNAENNRKRIQKLQKGGFRPGHAPVDDGEKDGIALLASCTTGWETMTAQGAEGEDPTWEPAIFLGGQRLEFTEAEAVKLYAKYPWIKEQVDAVISDRAVFMKG
jgi:hypothetical protein